MHMRSLVCCLVLAFSTAALAQTATLRIEVRSDTGPIGDADVVVNGTTHRTDGKGVAVIATPPGHVVERVFGKVRLFVNGENLNNFRQTQYNPLIRPQRGIDGRWTVDAWGPLDGRNINAGIRLKF
jgi:hypothetical protein